MSEGGRGTIRLTFSEEITVVAPVCAKQQFGEAVARLANQYLAGRANVKPETIRVTFEAE